MLIGWIGGALVPPQRVFHCTSYGIKHDFEQERDGFYVKNGAFKGAMLVAGLRPVDANELNWRFRVKPARTAAQAAGAAWRTRGPHHPGHLPC